MLKKITLIFMLLLSVTIRVAHADTITDVKNNHGDTIFQLHFFDQGGSYFPEADFNAFFPETDSPYNIQPSSHDFTKIEISDIASGAKYWADILSPTKGPVQPVIVNIGKESGQSYQAAAYTFFANDGNSTVQDILVNGNLSDKNFQSVMFYYNTSWGTSPKNSQLVEHRVSLEPVMIHEFAHAMGISEAVPTFNNYLVGDDPGSIMFSGPEAVAVYGDQVPMSHGDASFDTNSPNYQERSHFGVMNALMTHLPYNNFPYFMEVELAALRDIGYTQIDLRNQFGRSIYTDSTIIENDHPFYESLGLDANGHWRGYKSNTYNTATYGLGLHVFGSNNTILQNADILSQGFGGGGIRLDGLEGNTLTIAPKVKIHALGENGTGVLVSFGFDHTLINRGEIKAPDPGGDDRLGGIGVRFDFGVPYVDSSMSSYMSYNTFPEANFGTPYTVSLSGPLVSTFDLTGSIEGGKAAIYISQNAHVAEINIMDGARIKGDIISDYDNQGQGFSGFPGTFTTRLTFGQTADAHGQATNVADPNFTFIINDDILGYGFQSPGLDVNYRFGDVDPTTDPYHPSHLFKGRGLIDLELYGGQTTLNSQANIKVNSFTMEPGATLLGQADFGFGHYSKVQANTVELKSGSYVGLDQGTLNFGPALTVNQNYPLVGLELLGSTPSFSNNSSIINSHDQTIMVGINDYDQYDLAWDNTGKTLYFQPQAPGNRNSERAGDTAAFVPVAGAVYDQGWSNILNRAWVARSGNPTPATGEMDTLNRIWGGPFYSYTHNRGSGDRAGYSLNAPGLALCLEHSSDNNGLTGLAFSLAWPESKNSGLKNEGTSWTLAAYGSYELPGQVELGAALGLGQTDHELTRHINNDVYLAKYSSRTLRTGLTLGRAFDLTSSLSLRPRLLGDYLNIKIDGYQESAGQFSLTRQGESQNLWRTELLAELLWQSDKGSSLGASLGWARLYGDLATSVQSFFTADAPDYNFFQSGSFLDRDSLTAGLTSSFPLTDGWSLNADYNGIFGHSTDSHSGELKIVFNF